MNEHIKILEGCLTYTKCSMDVTSIFLFLNFFSNYESNTYLWQKRVKMQENCHHSEMYEQIRSNRWGDNCNNKSITRCRGGLEEIMKARLEGGMHDALDRLHRKGEAYNEVFKDEQEFVRWTRRAFRKNEQRVQTALNSICAPVIVVLHHSSVCGREERWESG